MDVDETFISPTSKQRKRVFHYNNRQVIAILDIEKFPLEHPIAWVVDEGVLI